MILVSVVLPALQSISDTWTHINSMSDHLDTSMIRDSQLQLDVHVTRIPEADLAGRVVSGPVPWVEEAKG